MGQKRKKPETPKHSNFMSWITTPPLSKFQGLKKLKDSESSPITTSIFDPSPILQRKPRDLLSRIEKKELLNALDAFHVSTSTSEQTLKTTLIHPTPKEYSKKDKENGYIRYIILEKATLEDELQLRLLDQSKMQECILKISGKWLEIDIKVGEIINVLIDDQKDASFLQVNNHKGIFVIDPDELLSATSVSDSYVCTRRSILREKIKYNGPSSQSMVNGNLVHELFQEAVRSDNFSYEFLVAKLNLLIKIGIEEIYSIGISDSQTFNELKKFIPLIQEWHTKNYSSGELKIIKPLEIEERIWSYKLGLKGFIDITAQIQSKTSSIVPVELKTGKNKLMSHRAQTQLYTMMIKDKYKVEVDFGLLVYLQEKGSEMKQVPVPREELVYLMVNRNIMAGYLAKAFVLPKLTDNYSDCERCYINDQCMIYNKVLEDGHAGDIEELRHIYLEKTQHLNDRHLEFLKIWDEHITVEENNLRKSTKNLWATPIEIRERIGTCIRGLVIEKSSLIEGRYSFEYLLSAKIESFSFLDTSFSENDLCIISLEAKDHPLAVGFVKLITKNKILVYVDRQLDDLVFKIDQDQYSSGVSVLRGNLLSLFNAKSDGRFRKLLVDLEPPRFNHVDYQQTEQISELNEDQKQAILKSISAKDYSLILGMPGTGKTSTIANLIKVLVSKGKSCLLTSYTHSAVDNLLLKLSKMGLEFLRLGSLEKMHPVIKELTIKKRKDIDTTDELTMLYDNTPIVATTALSIPIFGRRRFDYCIIDESSQIALPVCLGPLQMAEKFVLVGDHYQLPPLFAQAEESTSEPMSLFKYLSEAHPIAISYLKLQYRMNEDIMTLANELIYDNRLDCGNDTVRFAKLQTPLKDTFIKEIHKGARCKSNCWLEHLLNPNKSVVFCDTDMIPALETKQSQLIDNQIEVELVYQTVTALINSGVKQLDIGVMSPYKYQLQKLSKALSCYPFIELLTVDKFQGRDKKCIILSLVRSNELFLAGELVKDWKRVNVAITRAEQKFIFFGSRKTIGSSTCFGNLFRLLGRKEWILQLPTQAQLLHRFESHEGKSTMVSKFGSCNINMTLEF